MSFARTTVRRAREADMREAYSRFEGGLNAHQGEEHERICPVVISVCATPRPSLANKRSTVKVEVARCWLLFGARTTTQRAEVIDMAVEIKTTNNKELSEKKRDYLAALRRSTGQPSASIEELRMLAHSGMLDKSERALYDDLSVVLMLLGEGQLESA